MVPFVADLAGPLDAAHGLLLLGPGALGAGCTLGMVRVCRAEAERRRVMDGATRRLHAELAEYGYRFLFASPVLLALALGLLYQHGAEMVGGLLVGGVAALTYALGLPDRLARRVDPGYLERMDHHDRRLHHVVSQHRNPWLVVLATLPFFALLAAYQLQTSDPLTVAEPAPFDMGTGALFGICHVGLLAWGVQYIQTLRAIRREGATVR